MATKVKTSSQLYAQLKRLAADTKKNIFDMVRLTHEITQDKEYIDTQWKSEAAFLEHIQDHEFSHFGGSPKIDDLLLAYRKFPSRSVWEEHGYNVWVLIDLANPIETRSGERISWKARCQELEAENLQLKAAVQEYRKTNAELRGKVESLTGECGELRGRIIELERLARERR